MGASMGDKGDPLATQTRATTRRGAKAGLQARLRAVYPPDLSWSATLGPRDAVIGRTADADAPALPHSTVSRNHLRIAWDGRRHTVTDLGSHNGTRVDGKELSGGTVPLTDGTVVCPGDICLVYETGAPGDERGREVGSILGSSPAVGELREAIARAAPDPSPVLILGETGTGKEFIAREVHRLSGRAGPLVAINCAALSPELIDSQLFGHVKGAFTGAATDHAGLFRTADGGTLFLDEIGEMPLSLQPKLLRALQEGEVQPVGGTSHVRVDVRVVAATNQPLVEAIEQGTFRRDLYARLALWEIAVPSLAARRGDLLQWLACLRGHWLQRRERTDDPNLPLDPEAAEAIVRYPWPNNLRQLDRLVHELSARDDASPIGVPQLPQWLRTAVAVAGAPTVTRTAAPKAKPPVPSAEEFTAQFRRLGGNVRALARHFARDRKQIYRWIETHGLADHASDKG